MIPTIAVYFIDGTFSNDEKSQMTYQIHTSGPVLTQINSDVLKYKRKYFKASFALVVTWLYVKPYFLVGDVSFILTIKLHDVKLWIYALQIYPRPTPIHKFTKTLNPIVQYINTRSDYSETYFLNFRSIWRINLPWQPMENIPTCFWIMGILNWMLSSLQR